MINKNTKILSLVIVSAFSGWMANEFLYHNSSIFTVSSDMDSCSLQLSFAKKALTSSPWGRAMELNFLGVGKPEDITPRPISAYSEPLKYTLCQVDTATNFGRKTLYYKIERIPGMGNRPYVTAAFSMSDLN